MIQVKKLVFNALQENTYILYDESKECVIVDAGCQTDGENGLLDSFIQQNGLKPVALINTHCHFDHIYGADYVLKIYKIPFWTHRNEVKNVDRFEAYASLFGLNGNKPPMPTNYFEEGKDFEFGVSKLKVLNTPGHSAGGVCFYAETEKFVITGDSLFAGAIGRTDLPGGDLDLLTDSLLNVILKLPEETMVYCGHGPDTEIGRELRSNDFISEMLMKDI